MTNDDEPLDVEMSGDYGRPQAVAIVLLKAAKLMKRMPSGRRYGFELEIREVSAGEDGDGS